MIVFLGCVFVNARWLGADCRARSAESIRSLIDLALGHGFSCDVRMMGGPNVKVGAGCDIRLWVRDLDAIFVDAFVDA